MAPPGQLARLWPRIRPYRGALSIALVTLLLSGGISLAFPQLAGYLVDAAFVRHSRSYLDQIALGLVGLFTVQAALNYIQTYLLTATGERAVAGLRRELFGKLLEMPPGFFADRRIGELTSRLAVDIGLLQAAMSTQAAEFFRQTMTLVGGILILTLSQPHLMLTALFVAPLVVGSAVFFGRRLRKVSKGLQDKVADANAMAEETLSQIRTVQSFVQEPTERGRYTSKIQSIITTALTRAHVRGIFFGVITLVTFWGVTAVLWQGGREVLAGRLTEGDLIKFVLYTLFIAGAVGGLVSLFGSYNEAVGAATRVFELLEQRVEVADPAGPVA
ncbi:MAG TPA: ABC transporter transmembrane domain-containing protein, partial [bacterium]|nr:ABC transporter transmembrane domain-containing protein [bacterium]